MLFQIIGVLAFTFASCCGGERLSGIILCDGLDGTCFKREMQSILTSLQNNPEKLNVKAIQPMKVKNWIVAPGRLLNFEQVYENVRTYNHHFSSIQSVQISNKGASLLFSLDVFNPEVATRANYEFVNATFLGKPVSSKGKVTYRHVGYEGQVNITAKEVWRKGEKHLSITDCNVQFSATRILFSFKTGNPTFDNSINKIFNDNWSIALNDVKSGYEAFYAHTYRKVMDNIFALFSYDDLFLS